MSFKKHPDFLGNDKIRMKAFDRFRDRKNFKINYLKLIMDMINW